MEVCSGGREVVNKQMNKKIREFQRGLSDIKTYRRCVKRVLKWLTLLWFGLLRKA